MRKGFTLIELLIVFTITGILIAMGMGSYSSYNNSQSVQNANADVINILTTAKSRAISQAKPPQCGTTPLSSYRVTFSSPQYALQVVCGGTTHILKTQQLPSGVTFATGTTAVITFAAFRGTATPGSIVINGHGRTKNITVSAVGTISSN